MSLSLGNDGPTYQQPRVPRGRQRGEEGSRARLLGTQHVLERLAEPAGVEDIELTFPTSSEAARPTTALQAMSTVAAMPRLATFYGIVVAMYFDDHPPPHVHARYGEFEAQVGISSGDVLNGFLPRRAAGLVREWIDLHRGELDANWERARAGEPLTSIEPLP